MAVLVVPEKSNNVFLFYLKNLPTSLRTFKSAEARNSALQKKGENHYEKRAT